jgi:hypothetical protein
MVSVLHSDFEDKVTGFFPAAWKTRSNFESHKQETLQTTAVEHKN